eukprot:1358292-Pyramimonas_sp.AAC.1
MAPKARTKALERWPAMLDSVQLMNLTSMFRSVGFSSAFRNLRDEGPPLRPGSFRSSCGHSLVCCARGS